MSCPEEFVEDDYVELIKTRFNQPENIGLNN